MILDRIAFACVLAGATGATFAADTAEVNVLKQQMEEMRRQLTAMQQKLDGLVATPSAAPPSAQSRTQPATAPGAVAQAPSAAPPAPNSPNSPNSPIPGAADLSTTIGGATMTLYGFVDVSADAAKDGVHSYTQISSNLSYLGVRAIRPLGTSGLKAVAQIETLANVSGTPTEASGLSSRNSFIGLEGGWGRLALGKYDTPYKRATAAMDPFASSVADYNSIMGNTGGDLRAEFDARLPHSVFYDSPSLGGFSVNALYSPGQKFADLQGSDKYAFAQGEFLCSGSSPRGSGSLPDPTSAGGAVCDDGAFTNAWSIAANYEAGSLFATIAYERHAATNRTSDTGGVISDESAAKVGASYQFGSNRLSGIYEKFYRAGGVDPTLNERARTGYYLSDVQQFGPLDVMLAWAHANQTPGGPDFGTIDDKANMYALGTKYHYDKWVSLYAVGTLLKNGPGAHYALGAGGHGVPIASPRDDSGSTIPGKTLQAISVGMQFGF